MIEIPSMSEQLQQMDALLAQNPGLIIPTSRKSGNE
jgi:hypothetical protein